MSGKAPAALPGPYGTISKFALLRRHLSHKVVAFQFVLHPVINYALVHQTRQNQEPSWVGHNSNGKLRYSWAVDLDATG